MPSSPMDVLARRLPPHLRKPALFAGFGAAGCLVAALLAEAWQHAMNAPGVVNWFLDTYDRGAPSGAPSALPLALHSLVVTPVAMALLAVGIGQMLMAGQNVYLGRGRATRTQVTTALLGGALAGVLAGIVPEVLFQIVKTWTSQPAVVEAARVLAWGVLGALVAVGLSLVVPNLRLGRAAAGGAAGGVAGGVAFVVVLAIAGGGNTAGGATAARLVGLPVIGAAIGGMIAWAEVLLGGAALIVCYGPRDRRVIPLGPQPVRVGSDREICAVVIRELPPEALRYRLDNGRVFVDDVAAGRTEEIKPGYALPVGRLTLVIDGAAAGRGGAGATTAPATAASAAAAPSAAPSAAPAPRHPAAPPVALPPPSPARPAPAVTFVATAVPAGAAHVVRMRRRDGAVFAAVEGAPVVQRDVTPSPDRAAAPYAEVARNANDPSAVGLRNLSARAWRARLPDGRVVDVPTGRVVRAVAGTVIDEQGMRLTVI